MRGAARGLLEGRIEGDWISFRTVWKNRPAYGGGPGGQTTYRDWWTDYRGRVYAKSIDFFMQRDGEGYLQVYCLPPGGGPEKGPGIESSVMRCFIMNRA